MGLFHFENLAFKTAKKIVIGVIGATVLVIGILGIVLPVIQAWILIPLGLAILATEFVWARRLLRRLKRTVNNAVGRESADCDEQSDDVQSDQHEHR